MKRGSDKKGVTVRIYSGYTSKEMQWVVRSSTGVLVFTKGKVVLIFYTIYTMYYLENLQTQENGRPDRRAGPEPDRNGHLNQLTFPYSTSKWIVPTAWKLAPKIQMASVLIAVRTNIDTVLSSASTHPRANFDSSVVCEVLRVTAHHEKKNSKLHSVSSSRLFRWRHYIRQQGLHTPVIASSAAFFTCSTKFHVLQATNAAKPWKWDFGLVHSHRRSYDTSPFSSACELTSYPRWVLARA